MNGKNQLKISLFANEKELFQLLHAKVVSRINEKYLPKSSRDFSKETVQKMIFIDSHYQKGIISREMAIQIMSSIIEYEAWLNKYKEYNQDLLLEKIKEIDDILWIKRKKLFSDLESGKITKIVFTKINSLITGFEKNNYINNLRIAVIMDNPEDTKIAYNSSMK